MRNLLLEYIFASHAGPGWRFCEGLTENVKMDKTKSLSGTGLVTFWVIMKVRRNLT